MDQFHSLSLHDASQDDYMDIDGHEYSTENEPSEMQDTSMEGVSGDIRRGLGGSSTPLRYDSDTDDEDTSFAGDGGAENSSFAGSDHDSTSFLAGILSPTEMGARLAVGNQLLLPAPGDENKQEDCGGDPDAGNQKNTSVDYEFDTGNGTALTRVPPKNVSVFQNKVERLLFRHSEDLPSPQLPPATLGSMGTMGSGGAPYQAANNYHLNGVQVHHHHYYFNPFEGGLRKREKEKSPGSPRRKTDQVRAVSASQKALSKSLVSHSVHHDIIMPHPWDRRSSPQVRTVYVLSLYLQLLVNLVACLFGVYIVYTITTTIKHDISEKMQQEASHRLVEMAACRRAYHENQCAPDTIVPAMERACAHWQKCMNQDPFSSGNMSLVSAHTLGMILNSLVEPLGFKVLLVVLSFTVAVFGCNFGFGYLRARAYWGVGKQAGSGKESGK